MPYDKNEEFTCKNLMMPIAQEPSSFSQFSLICTLQFGDLRKYFNHRKFKLHEFSKISFFFISITFCQFIFCFVFTFLHLTQYKTKKKKCKFNLLEFCEEFINSTLFLSFRNISFCVFTFTKGTKLWKTSIAFSTCFSGILMDHRHSLNHQFALH